MNLLEEVLECKSDSEIVEIYGSLQEQNISAGRILRTAFLRKKILERAITTDLSDDIYFMIKEEVEDLYSIIPKTTTSSIGDFRRAENPYQQEFTRATPLLVKKLDIPARVEEDSMHIYNVNQLESALLNFSTFEKAVKKIIVEWYANMDVGPSFRYLFEYVNYNSPYLIERNMEDEISAYNDCEEKLNLDYNEFQNSNTKRLRPRENLKETFIFLFLNFWRLGDKVRANVCLYKAINIMTKEDNLYWLFKTVESDFNRELQEFQ